MRVENDADITRFYSQVTGLALSGRDDVLAGSEESESYDDLNRLTKSILTLAGGGGGTTTYAYDASGNRTGNPPIFSGTRK